MDKIQSTPAQHMEMALRMQGIGVPVHIMEQILETYAIYRRKRGKFSLSDAAQMQYMFQQKYPEKQPVNKSQEKEQDKPVEKHLPVLEPDGDMGSVYLAPGDKRLVVIEAKTTDEPDGVRCKKCVLLHTVYCLQMKCSFDENNKTNLIYQITRQ